MKKVLSVLLTAAVLLSLVACGGSSGSSVQQPSGVTGGSSASEGSADASGSGSSSGQDAGSGSGSGAESSQPAAPGEATIEETVLLDESGIKITAKELAMDGFFGPEIKLLIENDSGTDVTVQCRNSSVNGYMIGTSMSSDVVSGKKVNDSLSFDSYDLEEAGITDIAELEFSFHIFKSDGWDTFLDSDLITVRTSLADSVTQPVDDSGTPAYDEGGVRIVVKGLSKDSSIFGPSIMVFIDNTTDQSLTVQTRDVSVNGFMMDASFSSEVGAGKHIIDGITFMDSDLEENQITDFETVELSFHIFTTDGWDTVADSAPITITF